MPKFGSWTKQELEAKVKRAYALQLNIQLKHNRMIDKSRQCQSLKTEIRKLSFEISKDKEDLGKMFMNGLED